MVEMGPSKINLPKCRFYATHRTGQNNLWAELDFDGTAQAPKFAYLYLSTCLPSPVAQ